MPGSVHLLVESTSRAQIVAPDDPLKDIQRRAAFHTVFVIDPVDSIAVRATPRESNAAFTAKIGFSLVLRLTIGTYVAWVIVRHPTISTFRFGLYLEIVFVSVFSASTANFRSGT
jgi:hypothetical protein